ncbi:hypothetical protein J2X48_001414 [Bosea sp. BE271]|uniref:DUF6634 family protein n=1 Tax=Bosea TaxID=85413 RepID=UPI00286578E9|nr:MULTISPECIES: DUF6634 family protein [Bosea]MDR6827688.1 hypothetical protein [Bosea robiniae]MDR6894618.1 hypothetical protein [Bosea sp. BE109]MDR7137794.1 hypothetical protein [Bosea sp. BE168]MDR7174493.1 hypothetical protein [Bosea sp. BE271]
MLFDDPKLRADALERIRLLQMLTDDLTDILAGTRPTPQDLKEAVVMRNFMIGQHQVPCLIGIVEGHPRLGTKLITTSQLFCVDPNGAWARTFSRFYKLEGGSMPPDFRSRGTGR